MQPSCGRHRRDFQNHQSVERPEAARRYSPHRQERRQQAEEMLDQAAVSYRLVLTKADKMKPTELADIARRTEDEARKHPAAHPEVIAPSSETGQGMGILRAAVLEAIIG